MNPVLLELEELLHEYGIEALVFHLQSESLELVVNDVELVDGAIIVQLSHNRY